jgi:23S rRNA (cytosine1962-C5)-methyltransferase
LALYPAPAPTAMHRHLADRVQAALAWRAPLRADATTDCYRLLDGEDEPLYVDVYGDGLVVQRYADIAAQDAQAMARALGGLTATAAEIGTQLGASAAWIKLRPRQANTLVTSGALTPAQPAWGTATAPHGTRTVREHGLHYEVRPGDGLATGLYLDQRDNRRWLLDHARNLRVLNTFCYTAAFSVAAAAGGALRTVSIDAAAPALETARANLQRNGITDTAAHDLIRGDVLPWLTKLARRGDRFDLVILDPPSYSTVKGHRWTAARDYPTLVQAACAATDRGGRLLACINATTVDLARLRQLVDTGITAAGRRAKHWELRPSARDHTEGRMKSLLVRLD